MEHIIQIKNLNYTYPDGTVALRDINLEIAKGDSVGIVGPNGAGKTTLLLHLNGIFYTNGCVKVCELLVNEKNLDEIRRRVGLVFQDPDDQLFMPSVFEDVGFGPINAGLDVREVKKQVDNALRLVDMEHYKERMSHHLSFGEKKRISLATVLSMNPEILVLDEPTGNFDPKHRREFIKFLKTMEVTKLIATHDIELVLSICNKVAVMDKGRIVAFGKCEDIFENKELISQFL